METRRPIDKEEEEKWRISVANWGERVEDLVAAGDTGAAISFLESLVTNLESRFDSSSSSSSSGYDVGGGGGGSTEVGLQLASALAELANLYSSHGFSLKSDELRSRSSVVKQRALACEPNSCRDPDSVRNRLASLDFASNGLNSDGNASTADGDIEKSTSTTNNNLPIQASSDDDWEAIADRDPSELLSVEGLPELSKLSVEEPKVQAPKRRGRGTFTYMRDEMYSERDYSEPSFGDAEDDDKSPGSEKNSESLKSNYGTRHVLVVADFSPSLRTTDLEKLFEDFKDSGFVIRWVNDTTALVVFKTPSTALEACNRTQCSFTVRVLKDDDILLGSIPEKDLEPPCQRPKTSARTAQRLIAHSMGLKLPNNGFGSKELRNQEAARRNRIIARQKLRDDAWGDD